MEIKKILITGGAGFIGSNLSIKLKKLGYEVTVIDNLSEQIHGCNSEDESYLYKIIKNEVNFIYGSINNYDLMHSAISSSDAIIHLAAETGTGQSMYEIIKYSETNIVGTGVLIDILINKKHNIKKVIVASSRAIYGEGKYLTSDGRVVYPGTRKIEDLRNGIYDCLDERGAPLIVLPTDELSNLSPTSLYGITKHAQEQYVTTLCPQLGIKSIALRFQNVYGPGQSLRNAYTGIISIFSGLIFNNQEINIFEDGEESRDFIYIDDVVDAVILALEDKKCDSEIFNVGSGIRTTVMEVARLLVDSINPNIKIRITQQFRVGDIRHNYSDNTKIRNILKFNPKTKFSEGIKKYLEWAISQPSIKNNFSRTLRELESKNLLQKRI